MVMAIWDACGGSELGCDDIGGCSSNDIHDVEVELVGLTPFTTYLIQVDGWAGATGTASRPDFVGRISRYRSDNRKQTMPQRLICIHV